jgi:hypothetical protein
LVIPHFHGCKLVMEIYMEAFLILVASTLIVFNLFSYILFFQLCASIFTFNFISVSPSTLASEVSFAASSYFLAFIIFLICYFIKWSLWWDKTVNKLHSWVHISLNVCTHIVATVERCTPLD